MIKEYLDARSWVLERGANMNVPRAELDYVKARASNAMSDDDTTIAIATLRRINTICEQCGDKSTTSTLRPCSKCHIIYYCSRACQRKHWRRTHRTNCCNPDAPRQMGHSRSIITKTD